MLTPYLRHAIVDGDEGALMRRAISLSMGFCDEDLPFQVRPEFDPTVGLSWPGRGGPNHPQDFASSEK